MATIINTEEFSRLVIKEINKSMLEAAEPHIQEALKKIEFQMRKRMAEHLIALTENYVEFHTLSDRLIVTIKNVEK